MLLLFLGVTIGVSLLLIEYGLTRVLHNTTASTDLLVHQVVAVVVSCQFASGRLSSRCSSCLAVVIFKVRVGHSSFILLDVRIESRALVLNFVIFSSAKGTSLTVLPLLVEKTGRWSIVDYILHCQGFDSGMVLIQTGEGSLRLTATHLALLVVMADHIGIGCL